MVNILLDFWKQEDHTIIAETDADTIQYNYIFPFEHTYLHIFNLY